MSVSPSRPARARGVAPPAVVVTAVLVALGCVAFAALNVAYELTGRFDEGQYAEHAAGLSVMGWLVVGLKLVGAAVALLSVARHPRLGTGSTMTALLWGAFATFAVYAAGTVAQAVGMATGLAGSPEDIDLRGVAYVLGSLAFAAGFGVLAVSHRRRHGRTGRAVVAGILGAPALLALLLVAVPALLVAAGVMPSS